MPKPKITPAQLQEKIDRLQRRLAYTQRQKSTTAPSAQSIANSNAVSDAFKKAVAAAKIEYNTLPQREKSAATWRAMIKKYHVAPVTSLTDEERAKAKQARAKAKKN